jgi:cytoskeletal protein CcmA (bactofilin family)
VRTSLFKQTVNTRGVSILIGLVLLAVLLAVSPVRGAMETRSGQEVTIGLDEVVEDDLYVTANDVVVDGTIEGDLVAFGRSITVNGTVEGDLIAAGQTVEVGGTVEDDARLAGQALLLGGRASVGDDLLAAGYSLENEPDSTIGFAPASRQPCFARFVSRSDLAVILLRAKSNAYEDLAPLIDEANAALASIDPGSVVRTPADRATDR